MYDYLPTVYKLWVCAQCMELMTLREEVYSLEVRVVDLRKPKEREIGG